MSASGPTPPPTPGPSAASAWNAAHTPAPGPAPAAGPRPVDAVLVVVGALAALLEVSLRPAMALPLPTLFVVLALLLLLPWRRRRPLAVIVTMTVVGAALELTKVLQGLDPVGLAASAVMLAVPVALFRHGDRRARILGAAVLGAGMVVSTLLGRGGVLDALVGVAVLTVACLVGALLRERDRTRRREIDLVRATERAALARDLHDTVAHHVTAIVLRSQVARAVPEDREVVARSLDAIEEEAQQALVEMRTLVRDRPDLRDSPELAAGDHSAASDDYAPLPGFDRLEDLADDGPPRVTVEITGADRDAVPEILQTTLFRLAQEGITNARRHARAPQRIDVRLTGLGAAPPPVATLPSADGSCVTLPTPARGHGAAPSPSAPRLVLEVTDDGGPVSPAEAERGARTGHGIPGMRERVALAGGVLAAGPSADGGWRLRAELPLESATTRTPTAPRAPARHPEGPR